MENLLAQKYGLQVTNSLISMELMKTTVNVIDINYCNSSVSYEGAMKPGMFCAGRMNEGI